MHGDRRNRSHDDVPAQPESTVVRTPGKRTRAGTHAPVQLKRDPQSEIAQAVDEAWREVAGLEQAAESEGGGAEGGDEGGGGGGAVQAKGKSPAEAGGLDAQEVASRGTSGASEALPHFDRIQASFGHHDVSSVRAHLGEPASRASATLGAEAYASGNDVAFLRTPDLHTAAHEAAHVVQQRSGVHLKDGLGQDGDAYERHADAVADLVVSGRSAASLLDAGPAGGASGVASSGGAAIQRKLVVAGVDYTALFKGGGVLDPVVNQCWTATLDALNQYDAADQAVNDAPAQARIAERAQLRNALQAGEAPLKHQLSKWIEDAPGSKDPVRDPKTNPQFGRKKQDRNYTNQARGGAALARPYEDFARGLLGWVEAKPLRHDEKILARGIHTNPAIDAHLNSVLHRLHQRISTLDTAADLTRPVDTGTRDTIINELQSGRNAGGSVWGDYNAYYETGKLPRLAAPPWQILSNPEAHSFRDKVSLLHDLMQYFIQPPRAKGPNEHNTGKQLIDETGIGAIRFTTGMNAAQPARTTNDREMAETSATRLETGAGTRFAREQHLPVWASQSFTTARMLELARWGGSDAQELAAVAWGIFAFWRVDYDHTTIAYHTLHETLDVAGDARYGVAYNPLRPNRADSLTALTEAYMQRLKTSLENLLGQLPPRGTDAAADDLRDRAEALLQETEQARLAVQAERDAGQGDSASFVIQARVSALHPRYQALNNELKAKLGI